nr:bifunctional adenosylcobinamide kinase/adenosylcobinamide-phosphate guanylyltransferase [Massilia soli]
MVLGGARSGKSAYAETLALAAFRQVCYIATASAGDEEMARRIAHHRERRPDEWTTVEEPIALADAIDAHAGPDTVVLVDCLTLWLTNLIFSGATSFPETGVVALPPRFCVERERLLSALARPRGDVILVSNEVGMGIVPVGAVTRCFADEAGRLNQAVAAIADRVVLVAAGLPIVLKGAPC